MAFNELDVKRQPPGQTTLVVLVMVAQLVALLSALSLSRFKPWRASKTVK